MSCDGYITNDIWFGVFLMYLFGEESLVKRESTPSDKSRRRSRDIKLHYDIPSLDAAEYFNEFRAGSLAISDLRSFARKYTWITQILRDMERKAESVWVSPAWIAGRNSKGETIR